MKIIFYIKSIKRIFIIHNIYKSMAPKTQQINKAKNTANATKKTAIRRKYRVRTNLRFFKPTTLRLASKPKYQRSTASLKLPAKFDKFSVLTHPLNT
jgi:hypothetical protein